MYFNVNPKSKLETNVKFNGFFNQDKITKTNVKIDQIYEYSKINQKLNCAEVAGSTIGTLRFKCSGPKTNHLCNHPSPQLCLFFQSAGYPKVSAGIRHFNRNMT